jgi:signal transduction histidine kinase/CheY-like chemotaxis protein
MSERKPLIWICDDSPTEGAITRASLGPQYQFEYFEDGSLVVERLSTSTAQPDVLVLDWVMPGMPGDEVCRFLRSQDATKDLPIIITTASRVETVDVVVGLSSGADDYVARPFAPEELRARVNAALRVRELTDASKRERRRLSAVNRLAHALLRVHDVRGILEALAVVLVGGLCDGCGVVLVGGEQIARHKSGDPTTIAAIANITDPGVRVFVSAEDARALPASYREHVARFGLTSLAILALPESSPVHGVVTLTRDARSASFDADDIATIETCIEYCTLAIQNALRLDAERTAHAQRDAVLQSLPVGILVTDVRGQLTLANSAAAALLPGIAGARDLSEAYRLVRWYGLDASPITEQAWIASHALDMTTTRTQMTMQTADGAQRTVAMSAVPLVDAHGGAGAVTVLEDVTAERAVAVERDRVSRFQEEMVAIVGHDLRSPLGALIAGTDILHSSGDDYPTLMPVVTRMRSSGHRMTKIIDQLLDVTHARLGKGIPVEPRETSLRAVLEGVVGEATLSMPKTQFVLEGQADANGSWDADRLAQVFANLATNAGHYGHPGGPVTLVLDATDTTATVLVQNRVRGNPIPPALLAVLFDPFQRGRAGGSNAGGLGLGLYIVREIVQAHGGTIDVTSDTLTTFRITLPRSRPHTSR